MAEGRLDSLPGNHSPHFAPVIEPTLSTGIETLTVPVPARTWGPQAPPAHSAAASQVPASHQAPGVQTQEMQE